MTQRKEYKKRTLLKDILLTSLGWELALPIFIGALIGYQIDQHTNSSYAFTLLCLLIGIIAGYYNVYKHIELEWLRNKVKKAEKQDRTTS